MPNQYGGYGYQPQPAQPRVFSDQQYYGGQYGGQPAVNIPGPQQGWMRGGYSSPGLGYTPPSVRYKDISADLPTTSSTLGVGAKKPWSLQKRLLVYGGAGSLVGGAAGLGGWWYLKQRNDGSDDVSPGTVYDTTDGRSVSGCRELSLLEGGNGNDFLCEDQDSGEMLDCEPSVLYEGKFRCERLREGEEDEGEEDEGEEDEEKKRRKKRRSSTVRPRVLPLIRTIGRIGGGGRRGRR